MNERTAADIPVPTDRSTTPLLLLVIGDGAYATEPLPDDGPVAIGRATNSDVCIEHVSISRDHAILHVGPTLRIEDLGSSNGTWVREQRLPPREAVEIALHEAVRLGHVTVIVQRQPSRLHTRRVRTHAYFEDRVEDECVRADRRRGSFVVAAVVLDPTRDMASGQESVSSRIAVALRAGDLVAAYSATELEILLLDTTVENAELALARLRATLGDAAPGRIATASYPRDGRDPSTLLSRARERAYGQDPTTTIVAVRDDRMTALYALADRVAAADITVLLLGETGVGKEMLAETIHRRSPRARKPLLRLNCAALSETLLESELFGHERGAFTGAVSAKQGLFEAADGGVVFLDEVGELAASTQAKLLRVLDDRKVTPVGGVTPRAIDVRLVAATNRDLEREVTEGRFRLDLLYRLNAMSIVIPPLRERVAEIEPLTRTFLQQFADKLKRPTPRLSTAALALLQAYSWPGNVRELRNVIERAVVLCTTTEIGPADLPEDKMRSTFAARFRPGAGAASASSSSEPDSGEDERQRIIAALDACAGNQTEAAKLIGVSRRTLITRIERLAVPRPRKR